MSKKNENINEEVKNAEETAEDIKDTETKEEASKETEETKEAAADDKIAEQGKGVAERKVRRNIKEPKKFPHKL